MKFKAGIVGCGRIAGIKDYPRKDGFVGTHAQAYYRHPFFELTAAACPENREKFQKIWNVKNIYDDIDGLLENEKLDVISICSPNEFHFSQISQTLKSDNCPRVIFSEKPVCLMPSDFKKLLALSSKSSCKIVVNHTRRYDPGHQKVEEYIKKGELGNLICGRCDYYGGWLHNGSHLVDTLRMFFDDDIKIKSVSQGPPGRENDPCYNINLSIKKAPVDLIGFNKDYYQIYDCDFRFENGRINLSDFGKKIVIEKAYVNELNDRILKPLPDSPWKGLDSPMYHAIDLIEGYLKNNTSLSGHGVLLEEISGTMNLLWKVKETFDESK